MLNMSKIFPNISNKSQIFPNIHATMNLSGDNLFFATFYGATPLYKQIMMKPPNHIQSITLEIEKDFHIRAYDDDTH